MLAHQVYFLLKDRSAASIARLVAGSRLTEASRQIAREMLDGGPAKGQRP